MKILASLMLLTVAASAQTAQTATITLTIHDVAPAVISDIHTHWLDQVSGPVANLTADMDATTGQVTISFSQSQLTAQQKLPSPGESVLIEGEPASVVSVSAAGTMVITRGALPQATPAVHKAGAAVLILKYTDPWSMVTREGLRPYVQQITSNLGDRTAVFAGNATGTVQ